MLDINFIRENKDLVEKSIRARGVSFDLNKLFKVDDQRRQLIAQADDLRHQRNVVAREHDVEKGKALRQDLEKVEKELKKIEQQFFDLMVLVPNIPDEDIPAGKDTSGNKVVRKWGKPPKFDFPVKDHVELGRLLDIIDIDQAAKVTGARFAYLKNEAVMLEFSLIQYAFSILTSEKTLQTIADQVKKGYWAKPFTLVVPPVMIRPEVFIKMARIDSLDPEQEEEKYYLPKDNLYLIGSAEHTLGPLHLDEVIDEKNLPIRYVGFSTSFRREAGSYGQDTRGILRVHQFDKIEMESFTTDEDSRLEQDFIVAIQEYLMQSLELPYEVELLCTGDMGTPDVRQYDIETWIPSQNRFRETHTSDLMGDYQARRLNTKIKRKNGQQEFAHMNDATVFAIGRTLIAILENNQQKDGSVVIPEVLQKYTGFSVIKPK